MKNQQTHKQSSGVRLWKKELQKKQDKSSVLCAGGESGNAVRGDEMTAVQMVCKKRLTWPVEQLVLKVCSVMRL